MNYTLDFNALNDIEIPQVLLCNSNKNRYGEIFPVNRLNITLNFNAPNEISFETAKYTDGIFNPLWDKIIDRRLIYLQKFGYFEISVARKMDGIDEIKMVSGKSIEVELGQLYLNDFEINSGEIADDTYDPENPVKFYQPFDTPHSLLHLCLRKAPNWTIGHVDQALWDKQRTFSVNNVPIYDFLTGDVSKEFSCIFLFDDFNRRIDCFLLDTVGDDTNVFIDSHNFIKELNITSDSSAVKNCFKVVGGSGIHINEVNPNGTDYLWMLSSKDREDMSEELSKRLASYDNLYESKMTDYKNIMLQMRAILDVIFTLHTMLPASSSSTNWKDYGLDALKEKRDSFLSLEDVYKTAGYGDLKNPNYTAMYLPNHNKLLAIEAEKKVREAEIEKIRGDYDALAAQKKAIQTELDLESYLTINGGNSLWKELALFRREQIYTNDNYSVTDLTTDEEVLELEEALLEEAKKELAKACIPKFNFSTTMGNILAIKEFKEQNIGQFKLGNFIRVGVNEHEILRVRLIKIGISFDHLSDIETEFSEMTHIGGTALDAKELFDQAASAATSYDTIIKQRKNDSDKINWVEQVRKEGLNASLVDIYNADNMETTIDSRGILCRLWKEEKQDYELEQMHLINNKIVFTDDSWKSARMALGRIHIVNPSGGESDCYGLIADALIGKLIITESMYIGNDKNTFTIDNKGFAATNGVNLIEINPNNDNLFQLSKNGEKILYFNDKGNGFFKGSINASSITLSDCEGITINNGNGTFTVSADGSMHAVKGDIGGFRINDDCLVGGTNDDHFIRISSKSAMDGYGGYDDQWSSIEIGKADAGGYDNSMIRLEANGFARFGLANNGISGGSVRFNYKADDKKYTIHTKGLKVLNTGEVSELFLRYGTPLRSCDNLDPNKTYDLIKMTGEHKVVIGEMGKPQDMQIFAKDKMILYTGTENKERIVLTPEGVTLKGDCYVGAEEIATKKNLADLEKKLIEKYELKIKDLTLKYEKASNDAKTMHQKWDGHTCPSCNLPHVE